MFQTTFFRSAFALCLLFAAALPCAQAEPVRVLGLEIGRSTPEELRRMVSEHEGRLEGPSVSAITGGPLWIARGALGLEGLIRSAFVFDTDDRLVAVVMTLHKHRFGETLDVLRRKYRYVGGHQPFVGDAHAELRAGDVRILISAPHLGFEATLIYGTDAIWTKADDWGQERERERRQRNESRL